MTLDRHVANQAPDWRAAKPGHKAPARRLPKVVPMADHDECSWSVLVLIGIAAAAILLASAWGLMP